MKKLFILTLLFSISLSLLSQRKHINDLYIDATDSISIAEGLIPIQPKGIWFTKPPYYIYKNLPFIIDTDSLLNVFGQEAKQKLDSFDITTQIILQAQFYGDCHARFEDRIYLDTINKKLTWTVYNVYGGCRAMGRGKYITYIVPKPPLGYTIELEEVLVENIYYNGKLWNRWDK